MNRVASIIPYNKKPHINVKKCQLDNKEPYNNVIEEYTKYSKIIEHKKLIEKEEDRL